ncbi:Response regulator receiver domain-containing protein [Pseudomonas sp. B10]|uniref:response regulator transcription factor n=1 Tax=Pseudomonas sp. B10 TaxID=118613 RepID=UPI0009537115|nr:response regulator [Pseudomonas sp. B10]SIR17884.1 Response regulator receiver domain-containing protein [Pseudomonas sp. B10]
MHKTHVIAVVDDDEAMRTSLSSLLRASGYQVFCYAAPADYLASDGPAQTDCLISDIQMPGMDGLQMLDALRARGWRMPVIFVSAHTGDLTCDKSRATDVVACLRKPFAADELLAWVEFAPRKSENT